jgi:arabinoxylan arabinofuranohydrolase
MVTPLRAMRFRSRGRPSPRGLGAALLVTLLSASPRARADYPIASHRFLADPASLVHDGRLYLYASNDDDNDSDDGYEMHSIVCVSSSDLKNWTDHGEVLRVPRDASWASFSWAPALVQRNGTIFMYYGNNANGVGVASSTTPTGRFTDPKGSALVTSSTPGASGTDSWLFDPGIFVDDDGQAYLYFGGNGENNARVIRLNSDMISVSGSAIALSIPYFFEAAWMHKRNGTYYLSYSTNPENGLRIDYLTSTSPISGFTHRGTAGPQPPSNSNNNHAAIFEFNGVWYHAYHNRYVAMQRGVPPGYKRNLALERLEYDTDGTIREVAYTTDGLQQLGNLNPYSRVEAETFNAESGVETEPCSEGGMNVTELSNGDWVRLRGVDFGSMGARSFSARVSSGASGGNIELRLDSATGTLVGTCAVAGTGDWQTWTNSSCDVTGATGVKDVVLRFTGTGTSRLFNLNYWQFTPVGGGGGGAGGGGGSPTGGVAGSGGTTGGFGGATAGLGGAATAGIAGSGGLGATAGDAGRSGGGASSGGVGGQGLGGTSTTGGAPAGGVSGNVGGSAGGTGAQAGGDNDATGGCGCRTVRSASTGAWLGMLSFAAIAFARLRRRSRR